MKDSHRRCDISIRVHRDGALMQGGKAPNAKGAGVTGRVWRSLRESNPSFKIENLDSPHGKPTGQWLRRCICSTNPVKQEGRCLPDNAVSMATSNCDEDGTRANTICSPVAMRIKHSKFVPRLPVLRCLRP